MKGERVDVTDDPIEVLNHGTAFSGLSATVQNIGTDVAYLGGPDVSDADGFPLDGDGGIASIDLANGETLYAVCASGESTELAVLRTGSQLVAVIVQHGRGQGPGGGGSAFEPVMQIKVSADETDLVTGDGQAAVAVSEDLHGKVLVNAEAFVSVPSSSGTVTAQVRRLNRAPGDLLTTPITIDPTEFSSYDAGAPAVVDAAARVVQTGDIITVDVDAAGTGAAGLGVILTFDDA